MKLVINTHFGGFGLSPAALLWLIHSKSLLIETDDADGWFGPWTPFMGGYEQDATRAVLRKDGKVYSIGDVPRDHPDLVAVVEALGAEANGTYAQLKIVTVPDDVQWDIHEYDGWESVHEVHRVWT